MSTPGVPVGDATQLWLLWKRVHETLRTAIVAEVTLSSDLSEPELSVLTWLYESGGRCRQSEIAHGLRWDRTRLSHLLTRMQKRGYIERLTRTDGVDVVLADAGRGVVEAVAPELERIAQSAIVDRLGERDADALRSILHTLAEADRRT